VALNKAQS